MNDRNTSLMDPRFRIHKDYDDPHYHDEEEPVALDEQRIRSRDAADARRQAIRHLVRRRRFAE